MQIRELTVENFRGIRHLHWVPSSVVACLIGPGDSTKTTVLDAIELVLGSRWAVPVAPTDFHGGDTSRPLTVTATVGRLPPDLLDEGKFGLDLRGWSASGGLRDEPEPGDEAVLTIRFSVDDSLEPSWKVVNDRRPEGRNLPSRDRDRLGLVRLGGDIDRHLSWGRGSALTRNTDDLKEVNRVIAEAQSEARQAVAAAPLTKLKLAAAKAQKAAERYGVRVTSDYRPGLESASVSAGVGQLTLHHGDIPVRSAGLGSRRLNALALQMLSVEVGAALLVDEVEYGLEPYRLRHLLRELQRVPGTSGQVFLTTHSDITLEELESTSLYITRSHAGETTIENVGQALQAVARSNPEAFLARRVLVCEGKTEVGLCSGLRDTWAAARGGVPVVCTGTAFADGGGTSAGARALGFAHLGYATALLMDSDKEPVPDVSILEAAGVSVFRWPGSVCTELRVSLDLPSETLQAVMTLAAEDVGPDSVGSAVGARLEPPRNLTGCTLTSWIADGVTEEEVRRAFATAAHKNNWFRNVTRGEALGSIVAGALSLVPTTGLAQTLQRTADWVYAD